jgi:hypothetical protein
MELGDSARPPYRSRPSDRSRVENSLGAPVQRRASVGSPSVGSSDKVTLHEELVAILRERGTAMSTKELAAEVNRRGRYRKRDGTPITDYQVHGRTKNYPKLFERDGTTVRLR